MSESLCRCGHERRRHDRGGCATWLDQPSSGPWSLCECPGYDDSRLPDPGERLVFGVHRQTSGDAETAEAWPTMASWSARVRARTTRALRSLR